MKSANFVVLGDASIAQTLGKKTSSTDITMYDRKLSDKIFTFTVPTGFPEKVQSLIQSIALSEYAIVNVKSIDRELGEQLVALDNAKMEKGFIVANGFDEDIKGLIKSTALEKYEFVSSDEIVQKIESVEAASNEGKTKVLIDAAFEVKGVGSIALGVVRRGVVKKHDEMELFPEKKQITVRSIQMHDDDVESVSSSGRAGLAIKGATSEDIERGSVVAEKDSMNVGNGMKIKFEKSKFYKEEVSPQSSYHLCIGLQIKPVRVNVDGETLSIKSENSFAFESGERCILVDLNSKSVRIVGNGTIM